MLWNGFKAELGSVNMRIGFITAALCLLLRADPSTGAAARISAPVSVHFHSMNLLNIVRWAPGPDSLPGTTYTLEYTVYGHEEHGTGQVAWRRMEQCEGISHTECDLTEQTHDEDEEYYARVRAISSSSVHSDWTEVDKRFRPMSDTIFGPPLVKAVLAENHIHVKLRGPFRGRKNKEKKSQSLWKIFPHMSYNVSLSHNRSKLKLIHQHYYIMQNDSMKIGPLEYSSEYCIRAEAFSLSLPLPSIQSDWSCFVTAEDPFATQMLLLMLGGILPTAVCLFVLAIVFGFAYYYITGHKERLPRSTDLDHVEEKYQTFKPEKVPQIINLTLNLNCTDLSTGESKPSCLGRFRQSGTESDPLLPALPWPAPPDPALALPISDREIRSSYAAQQQLQHQHQHQDQQQHLVARNDIPGDDYGCVVAQQVQRQDPKVPGMYVITATKPEVTLYRTQGGEGGEERWMKEEKEEDDDDEGENEEGQTLVEWDPKTRVLKLPLLCHFDSEDAVEADDVTEKQAETRTSAEEELLVRPPVLTSVVVRQSSSEECGDEDVFAKMEKAWGLQIHSNTEL